MRCVACNKSKIVQVGDKLYCATCKMTYKLTPHKSKYEYGRKWHLELQRREQLAKSDRTPHGTPR